VVKKNAIAHFQKVDPILHALTVRYGTGDPVQSTDYFYDLVETIISQQLSESAASTIFKRFKTLFKRLRFTPVAVLALRDRSIRDVGISRSKTSYIKNIAEAITSKTLELQKLESLDDHRVIEELVRIKGIGPWTAEMFLMFSLARPDVFSNSDAGLRRAIQNAYRLKEATFGKLNTLSRRWIPYRTYACLTLWRSLKEGN
jgi:DNA-3-methyladenine glycosylase II